jgi:hypothetical protein
MQAREPTRRDKLLHTTACKEDFSMFLEKTAQFGSAIFVSFDLSS